MAQWRATSPNAPPKPPNASAPSTAAYAPPTTGPSCPSPSVRRGGRTNSSPGHPARAAAGPMGPHARLPRPLLHQIPPLLHHPRRAASSSHRPQPRPPRPAHHRPTPAHPRRRSPRRRPLALPRPRPHARRGPAGRRSDRQAVAVPRPVRPAPKEFCVTALVLTVDEAAERLRVSRWTLYNLIRSNQLRTVKLGRRRLVPVDALAECLDKLSEVAA